MKPIDYLEFFEKSMDMMCVANGEGFFIELNDRWTEVLGYSNEELMSKPFIEFVHQNDQEKTILEAQKLNAGEHKSINFENRYKTSRGKYKWLAWSANTSNGLIYASARDVSHLKNQEKYFSELQQSASIGYWRIDLDTNTPIWSDKTYDLHGVPRGSKIDMDKAINYYAPEVREEVETFVQAAIEKGEKWDRELPLFTEQGEKIWVRAIGCPVLENGELVELYGTFQEITENRNKELSMNYLVENAGDGFWDWHLTDDYEYMSPRFWEILGFKAEEKKHHPSEWQELIFKEDLPIALDNFKKHVSTKGKHPFWQEVRYRHKNGHTVWILCQGKVVEWGSQDEPLRMIGTHTDITQLKNTQLQLVESARLASLGTMAGGIAHEINNPLAIIASHTDLARGWVEDLDVEVQNHLIKSFDVIEKTIERISKVIKGMKQLLRDGSSNDMVEIRISELLENILGLCMERMKSKAIKFDKIIDKEVEGLVLKCSETQLSQVIINLIHNSIDAVAGDQSPWIKLSVIRTPQNRLEIRVSDSGSGVPSEIKKNLFEPFVTSKGSGQGTGLGLSISKRILEKHKGDLRYDDSTGQTLFIADLPL